MSAPHSQSQRSSTRSATSSTSMSASNRLSRPKSPTHIHVGGRFNSRFKNETGPLLSSLKKSSKLIAKNPTRFLEEYCVRRERLEAEAVGNALATGDGDGDQRVDPITDVDSSQLKSFIADLALKPCFGVVNKEPELKKKQELMKKRSTILKIASSNLVSVEPGELEGLSRPNPKREGGSGRLSQSWNDDDTHDDDGNDFDYDSSASALEKVIESYVQQIKTKARDMSSIVDWIQSDPKMADLQLPYGLPKESLKIPTNPEYLRRNARGGGALAGFIESSIDNFLLLDGEYHAKIEQITGQIQDNNQNLVPNQRRNEEADEAEGDDGYELQSRPESIRSHRSQRSYSSSRLSMTSGTSSSKSKPSTPWTLAETGLLTYILTTLEEDAASTSNAATRSNLVQYELTSRLFPDKSQVSVVNQKYCIKYKKMLEEKRASVINDWVHDKSELVTKINHAWEQLSKKYAENLEHRIAAGKQRDLCGYWSEQLDKHRREKCERVKRLQILMEPLRKKREAELQEQARREAERRKSIHDDVAKYRREKQKSILRQSLRAEREREAEEELRRARGLVNKVRVDQRRQEWAAREESRRAAEEARQAEQVARAAKLESIKEPVHIEYDPWNVISDTHASAVRRFETLQAAQEEYRHSEEQKMVKFFRESYSFSTEKVLGDRRLRLEMKLRESGLMGSSYARQVLQAMEPKAKPHLSTQIKFETEIATNSGVGVRGVSKNESICR